MAVQQHSTAKAPERILQQVRQGLVVGHVERTDAVVGFRIAQGRTIDFSRVSHHPRDRAQTARNAHRARVGVRWQRIMKHGGVKLIRLAVCIKIGTRKVGLQQRCAKPRAAAKNLVHETVLRAADRQCVQPRGREEGRRVDAT